MKIRTPTINLSYIRYNFEGNKVFKQVVKTMDYVSRLISVGQYVFYER